MGATVDLYDDPERDLNQCLLCSADALWMIFECLTYCDDCLPDFNREELSDEEIEEGSE